MVTVDEAGTLTTAEVMDLIEASLGERPSQTTMLKAMPDRSRTPNARIRLTAGMPQPLRGRTGAAGSRVWDRAEIESWLREHPRLQRARARETLAAAWAQEGSRAPVVRVARDAGMSWAEIAEVVGEVEGRRVSRQAMCERFRRLI